MQRCSDLPSETTSSLSFSCPSCHRKFGQKQYLDQHIGGKKCGQRRNFLERTACSSAFSLALSSSPGSVSRTLTRTLSLSEAEKVGGFYCGFKGKNFNLSPRDLGPSLLNGGQVWHLDLCVTLGV